MRIPLVLAFLLPLISAAAEPWQALFNGRDLSGWEVFEGQIPGRDPKVEPGRGLVTDQALFTVALLDGEPCLRYAGTHMGTLSTREPLGNFRLRLQVRWGTARYGRLDRPRNAGLLYHAQGHHGDVSSLWMHSHQFQIEQGNIGDYIAVGQVTLEVPGEKTSETRGRYQPAGAWLAITAESGQINRMARSGGQESPEGWNELELVCRGDEVSHWLNGVEVLRGRRSRSLLSAESTLLASGKLQLQGEGSEFWVRRIEWQALAP